MWFFVLVLTFVVHATMADASEYPGPYEADVTSVYDGDTFRADVHVWPGETHHVLVRVRGVDTPEIRTKSACEKALAIKAREFTQRWLGSHIQIRDVRPDKYAGRVDATIIDQAGRNLADALIQADLGRPYRGGKRKPWCK